MALFPCPSCARHVHIGEPSCPFCGDAMPEDAAARAIPPARKRLDRLATFTFATALVAAACGGTTSDNVPSTDGGGATQEGGRDGAAGDSATRDGGLQDDDGGMVSLYGMPYDAGPDGNIAQPYGLPPLDAGMPDINVQPPYGLPPLDSGSD